MSLNIKNRKVHDLARKLAGLTGESMTEAVEVALRERLERIQRESGADLEERLLAIGTDVASRLKEPYRSIDHADLLYDERGLPR